MPSIIDFDAEEKRLSSLMEKVDARYKSASPEEQPAIKSVMADLIREQHKLTFEYNKYQQQEAEIKAAQEGAGSIAAGNYEVYDPPNFSYSPYGPNVGSTSPTLNKEKTNASFKKELSKATSIDPKNIDVEQGLPVEDRWMMGLTPTEGDTAAALIGKYGEERVKELPVNGDINYLVKVPADKTLKDKWILANKLGADIGDLAAAHSAVVKEVPSIAAGIGAAIGASPSVVYAPLAANVAYNTVGGITDEIMRSGLGLPNQPMETLERRGEQVLVQAAFDVVPMNFSNFVARRAGKPLVNEVMDSLVGAQKILEKGGTKTTVPAGAAFGQGGLDAQRTLAGKHPSWAMSKQGAASQQNLSTMWDAINGNADPLRISQNTRAAVMQTQENIANRAAQKGYASRKLITDNFERQWAALEAPNASRDAIGVPMHDAIKQAEEEAVKLDSAAYRGIYDDMNKDGVLVPFQDVKMKLAKSIASTEAKSEADRDALMSVIDDISAKEARSQRAMQLRQAVKSGQVKMTQDVALELRKLGPPKAGLTFEEIKGYKDTVAGKLPANGVATGGSGIEIMASQVAPKLNTYLDELAYKAGRLDQWKQAVDYHTKERLLLEQRSLGAALRTRMGGDVMTSTSIADKSISDPQAVRDTLKALSMAQDANGQTLDVALKPHMQDLYLNKIRLTARNNLAKEPINADPDMLRALYGDAEGMQLYAKIGELNKAFKIKDMPLGNLTPENIAELRSALGDQPTQKIIKNIVAQKALEKEHEAFVNNGLVKLALEGDYTANNGALANAALDKTVHPHHLGKFLSMMPPSEKLAFKEDFLYEILNTYTKGGQQSTVAPYRALPRADKFLEDIGQLAGGAKGIEADRQLLAKMDVVLGKQERERFVAGMTMQNATAPIPSKGGEMSLRVVGGSGGIAPYIAGNLTGAVKNRLMAMALARKSMSGVVDLLARDVGSEQATKTLNKLVTAAFTTRTGIMSLAQNMGKDPNFDEEVTSIMAEIRQRHEKANQK
jgi:hypothetical protein